MPPTRKTPDPEPEPEPAELVLNAGTYIAAERQGPMPTAIVARDGTRYFPDEILAYLLWVEARRTDPDAELEDYDDLSESALRSAHVRGLLGKAGTPSMRPKTSGPVPGWS